MRYFTADPHYAHEGVLEFCKRPFASITDHDDCLIAETNAIVMPTDELFIVGDYCWTGGYKKPGHFRNRIKCRTVKLIWGNHDNQSVASQFSETHDVLSLKLRQPGVLDPVRLFLSHYPLAYWPASHHGSLHLYGHCHDQREETLDRMFPGRRSMDCGVDTAKRLLGKYRPFSEIEILKLLLARPGHDSVEFYTGLQAARGNS
jgi:calcineurin-like phosphoesterase family protein